MRALRAVCCLILLFSTMPVFSLANSVSSASMTIEAFKEVKAPDGEFEVKVYYLDEGSSKTEIKGIGNKLNITGRSFSSLTKVFSVSIRSNYGNSVDISFRFGPFVNQLNKNKVVPATYIVSADNPSWSSWKNSGRNTLYRFKSAFSPDITSSTAGEIVTATDGEKTISIEYSVEGQRYTYGTYYDYDPGTGVIALLGTDVLQSTIYGSLMIADSDYSSMEPNVDYVSNVVISMEVI